MLTYAVLQPARQRYTFDEYLELERVSPVKHEFLDGHVWAMAGGSPDHAAVAVNVSTLLATQLRGRRCRVFDSDLRIRVLATGLGTYPDITVVCGTLQFDPADAKRHTVVNPSLVVEVLSPSTEEYDRGEKLTSYKLVDSLQEIVLIAHDARRIEVWRRVEKAWRLEVFNDNAVATLAALGCTLALNDVYADPLSD